MHDFGRCEIYTEVANCILYLSQGYWLDDATKADDPPQSKIARSVCPKKGFILFFIYAFLHFSSWKEPMGNEGRSL